MIIPVRCFTCGRTVGGEWEPFRERVAKGEAARKVLDSLGLERYCCRRMLMSHVELVKEAAHYE